VSKPTGQTTERFITFSTGRGQRKCWPTKQNSLKEKEHEDTNVVYAELRLYCVNLSLLITVMYLFVSR